MLIFSHEDKYRSYDETKGSTGFIDTHKKLYKHPHAKCKGFQGDLNCYA